MHRSQPDRRMLKTCAMQTERSVFRWLLEPLKSARTPFPRKLPDSPSMLLTGNTQGRNSQGRRDRRWIFRGRMEDRPAATAAFIASKIFNGSRFLRSEEPTVRPKCLGIFEDHPGLRSFVCRQTADPAQVRQPQGVSSVIFRESQMGWHSPHLASIIRRENRSAFARVQ